MGATDVGLLLQVGNGARYFNYFVISAGRQLKAVNGVFQKTGIILL